LQSPDSFSEIKSED